jgi:hypothetical protein
MVLAKLGYFCFQVAGSEFFLLYPAFHLVVEIVVLLSAVFTYSISSNKSKDFIGILNFIKFTFYNILI